MPGNVELLCSQIVTDYCLNSFNLLEQLSVPGPCHPLGMAPHSLPRDHMHVEPSMHHMTVPCSYSQVLSSVYTGIGNILPIPVIVTDKEDIATLGIGYSDMGHMLRAGKCECRPISLVVGSRASQLHCIMYSIHCSWPRQGDINGGFEATIVSTIVCAGCR